MQTINLKQYYPFCKEDIFVEVSDEIVEAFLLDKRAEAARDRKMFRYKAFYSLDCNDGIENAAIGWAQPSPEDYLIEKRRISRIRRTDTAIVRSHFFPAAYAGSPCPRPLYAGYESERYCRNGGYHAITGGKIHPCRTAETAPVLCSTEMDGQSMSISKEKRCLT